jgi:hypothetical protein
MQQIPSLDWPRRTLPLTGNEDLLKQNPLSDASPQEERVPTSLISNFTISNISLNNVGTGIGVFNFKNGGNFQFRSITSLSNKFSVTLNTSTIEMDVNAANIAAEISITDLANVNSPSNPNQYLMWDGTNYVFNTLNPFSFTVQDAFSDNATITNASTLRLIGLSPIQVKRNNINTNQFDFKFNGVLNDLGDVNTVGAIPDGYVLKYEASSQLWKPKPATVTSYTFSVKGDGVASSVVDNTNTLSILGNGTTISTTLVNTNQVLVNWTANLSDLFNVSTTSPSNNQVLTYNSTTNKWEPKNPSASAYTASNGLTLTGTNFKLGGALTENTSISGGFSRGFTYSNLAFFNLGVSIAYSENDIEIFGNNVIKIKNRNTEAINAGTYTFISDSASKYIGVEAHGTDFNKQFILRNTPTEAALFYQSGATRRAGYVVEENKIKVLDGVNTPAAGHVLTFMSDSTAQWRPLSGGSGGGDNWGTQAVVRNSTLNGDGTLAAPLGVANPLPGGYNTGDYLGVSGSTPTWMPLQQYEIIGICEIARDSDVPVSVGKSFFVVPPQLSGWQIKNYAASVYTLGSGGTTNIQLNKNGIQVAASTLSMTTKYATKTSIDEPLVAGDLINIEITGAKTTKDKGLTITLYLQP